MLVMNRALWLLALSALAHPAMCFGICGDGNLNANAGSRREVLRKTASAIVGSTTFLVGAGAAAPALAKEEKATAVLRSAGCARGSGEACTDLAEGNEFILNLQRKSQENAAQADADALAAYNNKNFPDFLASLNPPKYLVKQPDGKFVVYDDREISQLKAAGKIRLEKPLAKGAIYDPDCACSLFGADLHILRWNDQEKISFLGQCTQDQASTADA